MNKATKTKKKETVPAQDASIAIAPSPAVAEPSTDTQHLHVEYRPVEALIPSARNARTHSEEQVAQVASSIREYGWTNPVLVDGENGVIAGHARLLAARKLGLRVVPVIELAHLTEAQKRAYMLADNQLALNAEWDADLLRIELTDLEALDIDLGSLGFSQEELSKFMSEVTDGATDPDSIPAPPDEAVTRKGDLWILGDHRLLCGDSGNAADVDRLLDGAVVDLINADCPYNVNVAPRTNNAMARGDMRGLPSPEQAVAYGGWNLKSPADGGKASAGPKMRPRDRPLTNDFVSDEQFDVLLHAWFGNMARVLKPGGSFYVWGGYANLANYPPVLKECGLYFSQGIVWVKQHPVLTRKDFMGNFELAFYGWKEGAGHHFYGPNNVSDTWEVKKVNPASMIHLTEKPVELAVRAITYSSLQGENCLDLFGGSGSTLIACEQTGRKAFLMEIDPLYCDVIRDRWEQFTGKKAQRIPSPVRAAFPNAAIDSASRQSESL